MELPAKSCANSLFGPPVLVKTILNLTEAQSILQPARVWNYLLELVQHDCQDQQCKENKKHEKFDCFLTNKICVTSFENPQLVSPNSDINITNIKTPLNLETGLD